MIDASEFRSAGAALVDDAGDVIDAALGELGDDAAIAVQREVRAGARRHRRSGRLERNVRIRRRDAGGSPSWSVRAGGMVAPMIVGGTSPHTIRPVRSRALAMQGPGGGIVGFAGAVHHPGQRPDPFVRRGLAAAAGDVGRLADDTIEAIAAELADTMTEG